MNCPRCGRRHKSERRYQRCREMMEAPPLPTRGKGRGIQAIPTEYAGVMFRSRTEARWAAFFDLLGWQWDYEPLDIDGYIPDFELFGFCVPIIVEVKPYASLTELERAIPKIMASGWTGEALVVGRRPHFDAYGDATVGLLSQRGVPDPGDDEDWLFAPAVIGCSPSDKKLGRGHHGASRDSQCRLTGLVHTEGSFSCYRCADYGGGGYTHRPGVLETWRAASNPVQWKPKGERT